MLFLCIATRLRESMGYSILFYVSDPSTYTLKQAECSPSGFVHRIEHQPYPGYYRGEGI